MQVSFIHNYTIFLSISYFIHGHWLISRPRTLQSELTCCLLIYSWGFRQAHVVDMAAHGPVPPAAIRYLDPTKLTDESKAAYLVKVDVSSVPHPQGQCRLWTKGVGGSGYPRMRVKAPDTPSIQYGVHQVVYALNSGIALNVPLHDVMYLSNNVSMETMATSNNRRG